MILFNKNIDEDYQAMRDAVSSGDVSMERLDEAVTRILAMKASMGLVDKQQANSLIPEPEALDIVGCQEHLDLARKSADKAITLVKDTQNLLPISPEKTPRVRVYMLEDRLSGGFKDGGASEGSFIGKLSEAGFAVETFNYEQLNFHEIFEEGVDDLKAKVDLVIYVANYDTASNQTTRRIDWIRLMAADAPWFVQDIPTIVRILGEPLSSVRCADDQDLHQRLLGERHSQRNPRGKIDRQVRIPRQEPGRSVLRRLGHELIRRQENDC